MTLQAYRRPDDEKSYSVPFWNKTSGDETFGAGRYAVLDESDRTEEGTWIVEFNRAYSPFCAYNERYECLRIPMENWLDVRIGASEDVEP